MTAEKDTPTPLLRSLLQKSALSAGLALLVSLLLALIGFLSGWRSALQFSNGFFVTGAVVIILGLLAVWGGFTARGDFAITYAQSVSDMSQAERVRLWMLDSLRGYGALFVATLCGALLILLSILVHRLLG